MAGCPSQLPRTLLLQPHQRLQPTKELAGGLGRGAALRGDPELRCLLLCCSMLACCACGPCRAQRHYPLLQPSWALPSSHTA